MDVMPQADGHALVIPKVEAESIFDLPPDSLAATILATQRVARAVKKAFDAPGVMIAQLNGAAAGQSVFHIHFHVLPRHAGLELRFHARAWPTRPSSRSTRRASGRRSTERRSITTRPRGEGHEQDLRGASRIRGEGAHPQGRLPCACTRSR